MERIIYPPEIVDVNDKLIFLAGPIRGAADWQKEASRLLQLQKRDIWIANPKQKTDPGGCQRSYWKWVTHFLNKAGTEGVVIFWLAREERHDCSSPFNLGTIFELGSWLTKYSLGYCNNLAVGIEPNSPRESYLRFMLEAEVSGLPIHSSLSALCDRAIELLF